MDVEVDVDVVGVVVVVVVVEVVAVVVVLSSGRHSNIPGSNSMPDSCHIRPSEPHLIRYVRFYSEHYFVLPKVKLTLAIFGAVVDNEISWREKSF